MAGVSFNVMRICDKCKGTMLLERAVDMDAGLAITVFACLNCGRRKAAEPAPRPLTARY
jgi:DNA-directed RNA polymerase subunit M/transcription elongation factor TFIIS